MNIRLRNMLEIVTISLVLAACTKFGSDKNGRGNASNDDIWLNVNSTGLHVSSQPDLVGDFIIAVTCTAGDRTVTFEVTHGNAGSGLTQILSQSGIDEPPTNLKQCSPVLKSVVFSYLGSGMKTFVNGKNAAVPLHQAFVLLADSPAKEPLFAYFKDNSFPTDGTELQAGGHYSLEFLVAPYLDDLLLGTSTGAVGFSNDGTPPPKLLLVSNAGSDNVLNLKVTCNYGCPKPFYNVDAHYASDPTRTRLPIGEMTYTSDNASVLFTVTLNSNRATTQGTGLRLTNNSSSSPVVVTFTNSTNNSGVATSVSPSGASTQATAEKSGSTEAAADASTSGESSDDCGDVDDDPHYTVVHNGQTTTFTHHGINGHEYLIFSGNNARVKGFYVPTGNPDAPQVVGLITVDFSDTSLSKISWDLAGKAMYGDHVIPRSGMKIGNAAEVTFEGDALIIQLSSGGAMSLENSGTDFRFAVSNSFNPRTTDGILAAVIRTHGIPGPNDCCDMFDCTSNPNSDRCL